MNFRFRELGPPGMMLVETTRFEDDRGFFQEAYKKSAFIEGGIPVDFVQDNFASSTRGVLRGLHFQHPPHAQGKLVRATRGHIWDVGVDLREGSPTFGSWVGADLTESSGTLLYLPPGFAHGYVALSEWADVAYKTTAEFHPASDGGVRWDDPDLAIEWPIQDPILSLKDEKLPFLREMDPPFPA